MGDDDRRFLDASQELEKRDIQKKFDIEAGEKHILANANRKANRRIMFGSIALVSMLAIAITFVIAAQQRIGVADQKVKAADQKVKESKGEAEKFQGEATKAEDKRKLAVARGKDAEDKAKQTTKAAELRVAAATQQVEVAKIQVAQAQQDAAKAKTAVTQAKEEQSQAIQAASAARQRENAANTQFAIAKKGLSEAGELEIASRVEYANSLFELDQRFNGLLESLRAAHRIKTLEATSPVNSETKFSAAFTLSQAVYGIRERNVIPIRPSDRTDLVKFSPRSTMIAYIQEFHAEGVNTVPVLNRNGKEIGNFQNRREKFFSPDEKSILLTSVNGFSSGGTLRTESTDFKDFSISGLNGTTRETPSGQLLAINEEKGLFAVFHEKSTIQIWDFNSLALKAALPLVNHKIDRSFFSPSGQSIAVLDRSSERIILWNVDRNETQTFKGSNISFSSDSQTIAIATKEDDETISQFQVRNVDGRIIKNLEGAAVEFSPNSKTFAGIIRWRKNALGETPIKLWSIDGTELKNFQGSDYKFSPDGLIIAITDSKGIHLWKTTGDKIVEDFDNAQQIDFSPNSKLIITKENGQTQIYTQSKEEIGSYDRIGSYPDTGGYSRFSPDSKTLALALGNKQTRLINIETGEQQIIATDNIQFSQDGSLIAFPSADNTLRIMWTEPGIKPILLANKASESKFLVSPKNILVSQTGSPFLEFWNTAGQKIRSVPTQSAAFSYGFNKDGSVVYVVSNAAPNEIWLFNNSGNLLRKLRDHTDKIQRVAISPDGQTIASISQDGTIRSWNIHSGQALNSFSSKGSDFIIFTGDSILTSNFWDNSKKRRVVRILDINTGKESTSIEFDVAQLADSKSGFMFEGTYNYLWDGDRVASILKDGSIRIQRVDGEVLLEIKNYQSGFKFSPDHQKIAFLNKDRDIEIWDITKKTLTKLKAEVYAKTPRQYRPDGSPNVYFNDYFDFSPNSRMITASYEKNVTIKDRYSLLFDADLKEHTNLILDTRGAVVLEGAGNRNKGMEFSPNGEIAAIVAGEDNKLYIDFWSLLTGRKLGKLISPKATIYGRFTSDGKAFIYQYGDKTLLRSFDLDYLKRLGCDWLHDYLTNNPTVSESDRQMCSITSKK